VGSHGTALREGCMASLRFCAYQYQG
jgi:hypothetical protein